MKCIKSCFKVATCIARENIAFSCNNNELLVLGLDWISLGLLSKC